MKFRSVGRLRALPLLTIALALLVGLGACGFTTDVVATVGGERITRGELNAALGALPAANRNTGRILDEMIAFRLLDLEARTQKVRITQDEISARNAAELSAIGQQFGASGVATADVFQQEQFQRGVASGAGYRRGLREQLLIEKLRPFWYKSPVEIATPQLLIVESREKAVEATQKGRAGTPFDELLKAYVPANLQGPDAVGQLRSLPVDALRAQFSSFSGPIKQGDYSEPIAVPTGQFVVIHVPKIENRAPTAQEEGYLIDPWLNTLRAKYGVAVDPSLGLPELNTPRTAP